MGTNMSNKIKIILVVTSAALVLAIAIFWVYNSNIQREKNNQNSLVDNQYYVEKGLEADAKTAKPAVESYLSQDHSEPTSSRAKRLSKYFTANSQVYGYGLDLVDAFATKSSGKVTSFVACESDLYVCLKVMTDITLQSKNGSVTQSATFWITLDKDSNGSYVPNDIGEWNV